MATATGLLAEKIGTAPVPFDRFMEIALYDPEGGYYGAGNVRFGVDFVTSPHVSRLFAACLARMARAADQALGRPDPFHLFEGGPGEGLMALHLLDSLRDRHPDLYRRLVYVPLETSPALSQRQRGRLAPHAARLGTLPAAPVDGLYLSNELVDAFPVRRVLFDGASFTELLVRRGAQGFEEIPGPPVAGELARALGEAALSRRGAYRLEVNLAAEGWLASVSGMLRRGYAITIDYGEREETLYGPHRPDGTLRGFREGRIVPNPLDAPGEADLTASVNFSHLVRAGRRAGFSDERLLSQRDALFAWGICLEAERAESEAPDEVAALALRQEIAPLLLGGTGMGNRFQVLAQAKGAPLDALPLDPEKGLFPG